MTEQIPNALNGDLPIYLRDISGINYSGVTLDETYYGKTKHYFTTASQQNFILLSDYEWNLGDPCGKGTLGEMSVHLNNFFNFLRGIQAYSNTYITGSIHTVQNLAGQIRNISELIASVLRTLIQRVRNWVLNRIRELIDNALESLLTPLTKQIKEGVLQGIIEQLICAFDEIIDRLVDFVGDFLYALVGQVIQTPLCAVENYLNAMLNRLSSDIERAITPILDSLNDVLGGVLSVVGQINGVINQILGYESFFCSRPNCPEVKNFKASIWGGPTPSAIADFQNFTAAATGFLDSSAASAQQALADFFGPDTNTSQSPGSCYTGTFSCGLPQVVLFGGGGSGAAANAVVNAIGEVIGVNLLNGGSGYTSPPFVSIVDPAGCGVNASATAVLCSIPPQQNIVPIPGYTTPGVYFDLSSLSPTSKNITFTVTESSAISHTVTIPDIGIIPEGVGITSFTANGGRIYGPCSISTTGNVYIGNEVVQGIPSSGSLTNASLVVEEGGDDWDDVVITANQGIFERYISQPTTTVTTSYSSNQTTGVCQIVINNSGNGFISTTSPGSPVINSFTGTPNPIDQNNTITLSWDVVNATSVSLNVNGYGSLPLNGSASFVVNPVFPVGINSTTVTYTLTATNNQPNSAAQVLTQDFIVTVNRSTAVAVAAAAAAVNTNTPTINTFSISPTTVSQGQIVTLSWTSTDALFCGLSAGGAGYSITGYSSLPEDGSVSFVIPNNITFPAAGNATIDYTLTATNPNAAAGSQTDTDVVSLTVSPPAAAAAAVAVVPAAAAVAAAAAAVGTFTCTPSVTSVNEGDTIDFVVTSTDPADNGTFYYQIVPVFGAVTAGDFTDATLTDSFTIANNTGTISKTIATDAGIESLEQFNLIIKRNAADTLFLTSSGTITIQADSIPAAAAPAAAAAAAAVPAVAVIGNVAVNNTGIGYTSGNTVNVVGGNNGAQLQLNVNNVGQVTGVQVLNPGYGFTRIPELEINSREGFGAKLRANLNFIPLDEFLNDQNLKSIDPTKLVRIIDCVSR